MTINRDWLKTQINNKDFNKISNKALNKDNYKKDCHLKNKINNKMIKED